MPGKSFAGVKRVTVPNQSMSLRDIIQRFVRRESLPVSKEGIYEERFGDLEKLKHQDITVQMEKVEEMREKLMKIEKRWKDQEAAKKAAAEKVVEPVPPGQGGTPVKPPGDPIPS